MSTGLPQQINCGIRDRGVGIGTSTSDSNEILDAPRELLGKLCDSVGINFDENMLSWSPGPRNCDGAWAKHWYEAVWASSGFSPPSPREGELKPGLSEVLEEAMPLYLKLRDIRIRP